MKQTWQMHFDKRFDQYMRLASSKFLHATFLDPRFKDDTCLFVERALTTVPPRLAQSGQGTRATVIVPKSKDAVYHSILQTLETLPSRYGLFSLFPSFAF